MAGRVRSSPPPDAVMRVLDPVMRAVVPSPAGRLLPGLAVLRFHGRRTGRPYAVPVAVFDGDDGPVVFTDSGWGANFRGGADVDLVRRGRVTPSRGELVADPALVGPAIRRVLRSRTGALMLGVSVDRGYEPSDAELAAVRHAVLLRPR